MKRAWTMAALAGVLGACQGPPLSGPPTLHPGRDECAQCGMIINETKCSSALLIEEGRERAHRVFDDVGCMLDYEKEHGGILSRFVHDYASGAWIDAGAGTFLVAPEGRLATPMGSGIIAFAQRDAAEQKQRDTGGELTALDGLVGAKSARK
jgi:copper chaperone NosL